MNWQELLHIPGIFLHKTLKNSHGKAPLLSFPAPYSQEDMPQKYQWKIPVKFLQFLISQITHPEEHTLRKMQNREACQDRTLLTSLFL